MKAGIIGRVVRPESRTAWVLLTDAWHLDDLHLSRPECRRTEPSPKGVILKERSGLGYKYVQTYNCLMVWLSLVEGG